MARLKNFISYGKNVYNIEEINAVNQTLKKSTQMGANVKNFEKQISKIFGFKYGIMVNSGSSAILLCLKLLNLKKNDEIIVPNLNFGTAISSILICGLKPKFVDVDKSTLQIDENKIEKNISKKTKALMIPNLIGNLPNWERIKKIKKKYNLILIEDSADTMGATYNKKKSSFYADFSITSFYGSHVISCAGNGGMLMLNDKKKYNQGKVLRSWGRLSSVLSNSEKIRKRLNIKIGGMKYDRKFVFDKIGFNFEPSEIGASFGLIQLKKFKKFSSIRNKNFNFHKKFFSKLDNIFITPRVDKKISTNFLAYPIIIKENKFFDRSDLQIFLEDNNIQTRPIFSGNILRHPAFNHLASKKTVNKFISSDYIMKNGILIGCHQGLTFKDLNYIHKIILKFIKKIN